MYYTSVKIRNLLIPHFHSYLNCSSLSLTSSDKSFIYSLLPLELKMTRLFANRGLKEFIDSTSNNQVVLILCEDLINQNSFGLLIHDPL